jgi:hypothetical protein
MKELILKLPDEIEVDLENSDLAQGLIQLKLNGSASLTKTELLDKPIAFCDISVRLYNGLKDYFCPNYLDFEKRNQFKNMPISELSKISFSDFCNMRRVGKKSLNELIEFCSNNGITLQP